MTGAEDGGLAIVRYVQATEKCWSRLLAGMPWLCYASCAFMGEGSRAGSWQRPPEDRRLAIFRLDRVARMPFRLDRAPADNLRRARIRHAYLSVAPTSLNTVLTCVPTSEMAVMMNTAIKLAISAYS